MSAQGYDDTEMSLEDFEEAVQEGVAADVSNLAGKVQSVLLLGTNAPFSLDGRTWRLGMAPAVQSPRISPLRVPA